MALSHKAKRRWSAFILLVVLPLYAIFVVAFVAHFWGRLPYWVEIILYPALGILWVFPLKPIFRGVGRAAPKDEDDKGAS